ncbi:hypothetical protein D9Q98_000461 [Chlorella vulgaris]|uniref:Protein Mpv17 n=1 Tax=Chlorella vulgaris TaxID=3077 RepID=A0A9D4TYA7_CHLVU|nr:hypothetical protein D9Q98_000461 [Chlorella vulgaris]
MAAFVSRATLSSAALTSLAPRSSTLGQSRRCLRRSSGRQASNPRCQAPPNGAASFSADADSWGSSDSAPLEPLNLQQPADEGAPAAPAVTKPATGPLAAVKGALMAYDRAVKTRPVLTKAITSLAGFAIGDRIAQGVSGNAYDPLRCLRLSLYGLLVDGPVGHAWYKLLDKHVYPEDPTCTQSVLIKTALDQLVWGPIMTLIFFALLKTLEGHPDLILTTIQQRFWPTMIANYAVWPLAHLINFRYVPSDWRILFNNVIAIGWTTYLSFTCGGPSVVSPGGVEVAATAASTLLSVLPCHKVDDAMSLPGVGEAVQHVAAIEHIISCWGTKSLPNADLLVSYWHMKAEVMQRVCQQPIRLPPS